MWSVLNGFLVLFLRMAKTAVMIQEVKTVSECFDHSLISHSEFSSAGDHLREENIGAFDSFLYSEVL